MNAKRRIAALMLLYAALVSLPAPALAKASPAPAVGMRVVTGNIQSIHAGVITLIDGTSVFINRKTKLPNGPPTLLSRIRVTGTPGAKGNIEAAKIEIVK